MFHVDVKRGMAVRLATGGPEMIVESVGVTDVYCMWFTAAGELRRSFFDASYLERVEAPVPPEPSPSPACESPSEAFYCDHANENPSVCPCYAGCYCKTRTCKDKLQACTRPAPHQCIVGGEPCNGYPRSGTARIAPFGARSEAPSALSVEGGPSTIARSLLVKVAQAPAHMRALIVEAAEQLERFCKAEEARKAHAAARAQEDAQTAEQKRRTRA